MAGSLFEILLVYLFNHLQGLFSVALVVGWLPDGLDLSLVIGQQVEVPVPWLMGYPQFVYVQDCLSHDDEVEF